MRRRRAATSITTHARYTARGYLKRAAACRPPAEKGPVMRAVREPCSGTVLRACAVFGIAGFWITLLASSGCGDEAPSRAADGESARVPARLTDLSSSLRPAVGDQTPETTQQGARASQVSRAADRDAPRTSDDDPACQDTCMSKRAECGKVCGEDCGKCPNGEECQGGKCVCTSSCDGTLCANACGQACECAAGTACDVSGRCLPASDCSGPLCAPARELLDPPALPGPGDPLPSER